MKTTITTSHGQLTKRIEIEGSPDEVAFVLDAIGETADTAYEEDVQEHTLQ